MLRIVFVIAFFLGSAGISKVANGNEPRAVVPFVMENGIVLTLKINDYDKPLRFLFDTGADGIAVSKSLADSIGLQVSRRQETQVVGGSMEIEVSSGNTIRLSDNLTLDNQNIAIFENMGKGHDGILGLNLAYRYTVNIDCGANLITLYDYAGFEPPGEGWEKVDVSIPDGVMRIPGVLNLTGDKPVTGNFLIDTGANYHLICFEKFVRSNRLLLSGFKPEGQASTVSLGVVSPVYFGKAVSFALGDNIRFDDMPVSLQASTQRQSTWDNPPDGSIGIELWRRFSFTIHLAGKAVYFRPVE